MKTITIICIAGLTLAAASIANAEPALMSTGGVLDTLYGLGNLVEIETDQFWSNIDGTATAQAKQACYIQNFGYLPGSGGGTFELLFTVTANGYLNGIPSATYSKAETGAIFRFADDPSGAPLWSSQVSDNSDSKDHMKTFLVTGGANVGNYVVCWEDLRCLGDSDYQDLVVEVSGVRPIPEPATVCILGLGGLILLGKRRV